MKAYGKAFDQDELEHNIGATTDWKTDDKTIQRLKLSWAGKSVSFDGTVAQYTNSSNFSVYPVDEIRYAFVGGDITYGESLIGLRVLTFKMVDENALPSNTSEIINSKLSIYPNTSSNKVIIQFQNPVTGNILISNLFPDRIYTITSLPSELIGAENIPIIFYYLIEMYGSL